MEVSFNQLNDVLDQVSFKNNLEENVRILLSCLHKEIYFQSLGIYQKVKDEEKYQIRINRNLSLRFIKDKLFFPEDELIDELEYNDILRVSDPKYQFEYEFKDMVISKITYRNDLIGFIFIDNDRELYTPEEIARIKVYIKILNLLFELNLMQQKIDHLYENDDLTGLLNHKAFVKLANKNHRHMQRYKRDYSIAIMKINKFDEMAQVLGANKVPVYLQEISAVIFKNIRDTDFAGLLYPDTFGIILTEIKKDIACNVITRIHNGICKSPQLLGMNFNWGINDNTDLSVEFNHIFKQADEAMQESIRNPDESITVYK